MEGQAMSRPPAALLLPTLMLALSLGGCASLDARPAFGDVRQGIADRTSQTIQWNTGSEADAAVAAKVRSMLAEQLTLDEAVQVALLNNRRLQGTYEQLGVAQANLVQAGLLKNPIFDAELKFLDNAPGTKAVLEMAVIQDFMDIVMIPLRKRLAQAQLEATKAEVAAAVLDLASEVRVAFVSLQAAQQTLALRQQILQSTDASYDAAKRLREAGNITSLALANERAMYEESKLAVASAETAALEARERLSALMGLWGSDTGWSIAESLPPVPDEEMDLSELERRAVASSLGLAMLRNEMRVVASETGIDAAELVFPELAGGAAAEYEGPDDRWQAGPAVAVGIPIFDWGQARTAAGRHQLRRLWNQYTALAIEIRAAARAARYRLQNARRQSEYYRRVVVPLAEQITAETQLQYNAMQLGVFQLLQAKRREIDTRRQYILAQRDYWIARTELEQILAGRRLRNTAVDVSAGASGGRDMGDVGH
jgi:cobalt-zinc-cadmium efflux system outer membrane protein